jgi:hypothetical protein
MYKGIAFPKYRAIINNKRTLSKYFFFRTLNYAKSFV